jgi:ABC-type lipoprotein release transport system permease subunit
MLDLQDIRQLAPVLVLTIAVALVLGLLLIGKVPLGYNVRNLLVRWRITLLTALAFTLVVGLLTVMLAFVNGMTRLTEASGQPGNVMILSEGSTDELFSNLAKSDTTNVERQPGVLRSENGKPLCSKEVYLVVNQPIPPAEDPGKSANQVRGRIISVAPSNGIFVVRDKDSKEWTFHAADDGKVNLAHLPTDEMAVVVYEQRDGELWTHEVRTAGRRRFVQVRGIEDPLISSRVHGLELFDGGKWFSEAGVGELKVEEGQNAKNVLPPIQAVLGEGVARILGQDQNKDRLQAGDTFELGPRQWVVTGVMRSAGSAFGSEIWAKHSIVGPLFGKDQFTCLVVRTKDAGAATDVAEFFRTQYRPAVRAETETEYYAKLSETNKQFSVAIYFVTVIMAIGGIFGVMNTMFAAVSQRTKDIGVLRILGFARWQVLVSFFLETLVIALVGGLIGCALGYLCNGWTATSIISSGQGGGKTVVLKLYVDANTLAIGLLFTLIMGSLGGLVPALSAMRLRPLESLR